MQFFGFEGDIPNREEQSLDFFISQLFQELNVDKICDCVDENSRDVFNLFVDFYSFVGDLADLVELKDELQNEAFLLLEFKHELVQILEKVTT